MFLQYVGFTGAPGFILAAVWILSFGSLLVVPLLQMESTRESQGIIIQYKKNLPQFTDSLYLCYCVIISNLPIRIHSLVVVVVPEIELVSYLKKKKLIFKNFEEVLPLDHDKFTYLSKSFKLHKLQN